MTLTLFGGCNDTSKKCEAVQEWEVSNYKIIKSMCPDFVLAHYYTFDIYLNDQRKGNVKQVDSCIFNWQAGNDSYLTLNVCDNSINEIKPIKNLLTLNSIDSITIFSNEQNKVKQLSAKQIETFVNDWNNSVIRNYYDNSLDSVFSIFPAYQYKLTIFYGENKRQFFGYNYLILDDSKWQYVMSKNKELEYFHNYWDH
ncbi:MAG TPA: hypothetical protein PKV73_13565 [Agriterribacter sp.]|nr:hypothetical protein [Agriterribacter sp.]